MGHSLPPYGRRSVGKKGWLVLDSTYPQVAENLPNGTATSLNSRGVPLTLEPPCFSPSLWVLHISPVKEAIGIGSFQPNRSQGD